MNTFQDHFFDFQFQGDLNLLYCGNRERSVDHKYVHRQKTYLLTYVAEGEATLSVSGKKAPLQRGDFFVSFPASGASYVTKAGIPWSIRWVTLTGSQPEVLLPLMGFSPQNPVRRVSDPSQTEGILKKLFSIAEKSDLNSKLSALSLLYELFSSVSRAKEASTDNPTVSRAIAYISDHYVDPNLTVESLAAAAFLNANYFSKLFSAHAGMPPARFILKVRMEKAKKLLLFTELSVGGIAFATGFSDPLYFSRAFHRYTGLSPSKFRHTQK